MIDLTPHARLQPFAPFVPFDFFVGNGFSRDALSASSDKSIMPEGISYKSSIGSKKSTVGNGFSRDALSVSSDKSIMPEGVSCKFTSHPVGASTTA